MFKNPSYCVALLSETLTVPQSTPRVSSLVRLV